MPTLPIYRAAIQADWIDYNGHLRDAYYGLIFSFALDDLMDHLGLDAAYRQRTHCTLYTLEWHMQYLHEVKGSDALHLEMAVLDADSKRLLIGSRFMVTPAARLVTRAEVLLMHVHQGDKPAGAALPAGLERTLTSLKLDPAAAAAWGAGSRKIELKRRSTG
ncbi:MAG: thioesterase family protein [Steroidobacteraceae bacterium]